MIDCVDSQLIEILQEGLPITSRPYQRIAEHLNICEAEVIARISNIKQRGIIKRFGVIVNHRQLGYRANAMVVFNVTDRLIDEIAAQMIHYDFINLCYQRPRRGETWPYNLYCMIHGKDKQTVLEQLQQMIASCGLENFKHEILFSRQCFKQRGAVYRALENSEKLIVLSNG